MPADRRRRGHGADVGLDLQPAVRPASTACSRVVGLQGPAWLRDPAWAMPAMVVIGLWNVGVNVVVYVAALGTVPQDLHDAAALDGAGPVPGSAT